MTGLADNDQHVDVAVVTHIDSDHIGGMVPLLGDDVARSMVRDVWFNGAPHLPAPVRERDRSVTQGEAVGTAILGSDGQRAAAVELGVRRRGHRRGRPGGPRASHGP